MDSILDYFISLQESQSADMNEQSVEMWNRRAEFWETTWIPKDFLKKIMMSQILDAVPDGLLLHLPNMYTK
mgnify:CR=1 FL=1